MTLQLDEKTILQIPAAPLAEKQGSNFTTHILQKRPHLLSYRTTVLAYIFWVTFIGLGALSIFAGMFSLVFGYFPSSLFGLAIFGGIGSLFVALGNIGKQECAVVRQVDTRSRRVSLPADRGGSTTDVIVVDFADILAVQIVHKHVTGPDNHYPSNELNIVLKDFRRFNVIDHGNRRRIQRDAAMIAEAISCPIVKSDLKASTEERLQTLVLPKRRDGEETYCLQDGV